MIRIAVFASHNGSAMRALHHAARRGDLDAEICLLIADNRKASALAYAKARLIPHALIGAGSHPDEKARADAFLRALRRAKPDLIFLSGYMRKIPPEIIRAHPHILNIHPALLPRFGGKGMYGRHVHEAALRAGVKETGATIHMVDEHYDRGPIVAQAKAPVLKSDTAESLARRVARCEARLVVQIFRKIADGRVNLAKIARSPKGRVDGFKNGV